MKKLSIKDVIPENAFNNDEAKKELDKITKIEKAIDREISLWSKWIYINFTKLRTIRTFGRDIYDGKITLEEADEDQSNLIDEFDNFNKKTRPKDDIKKQQK